jgi:hypothetical protein
MPPSLRAARVVIRITKPSISMDSIPSTSIASGASRAPDRVPRLKQFMTAEAPGPSRPVDSQPHVHLNREHQAAMRTRSRSSTKAVHDCGRACGRRGSAPATHRRTASISSPIPLAQRQELARTRRVISITKPSISMDGIASISIGSGASGAPDRLPRRRRVAVEACRFQDR